jgi:hypothetical protein
MDYIATCYHAAMKMFPDDQEMQYWTAITLANNKDMKGIDYIAKDLSEESNGSLLIETVSFAELTDFTR